MVEITSVSQDYRDLER